MVAGCRELVHRKEQLIAEAGFEPTTYSDHCSGPKTGVRNRGHKNCLTKEFTPGRACFCSSNVLLLLPKHLPVGLAVGIKMIMFTAFPSSFQFGLSDVPVRTAFP